MNLICSLFLLIESEYTLKNKVTSSVIKAVTRINIISLVINFPILFVKKFDYIIATPTQEMRVV